MPLSTTATLTPAPAFDCPPTCPHSVGAPICAGVENICSRYGTSGVTARTPAILRTAAAWLRVIFTASPFSTTW
jgi:hypothetical protein